MRCAPVPSPVCRHRACRPLRQSPSLPLRLVCPLSCCPLPNLSNDPEQQYFADGITEDLTTDLSCLPGMLVISRNTAFTYRNKSIDTKQIGLELGVRYLLEGSVRRSGNQIRINAQLIDAETDTHLWAERFNGDTSDLFALQDEITSRIAVTLSIELVRVEAARPTQDPNALDFILRGRAAGLKPDSLDTYAEQITLFEHALTLDPQSVEARSLLANVLVKRLLNFAPSTHDSDLKRADELTTAALAIAPRDPRAHIAKGQVLRVQGRLEEAISEYETVLASNPNEVEALAAIGRCRIFIGPIDEAIPAQELAIRLSPRDPAIGFWYFRIGQAHLFQSRVEEAIPWLERHAASVRKSHSFVHTSPPPTPFVVTQDRPPPSLPKRRDWMARGIIRVSLATGAGSPSPKTEAPGRRSAH
jgi:adenylate cyclase